MFHITERYRCEIHFLPTESLFNIFACIASVWQGRNTLRLRTLISSRFVYRFRKQANFNRERERNVHNTVNFNENTNPAMLLSSTYLHSYSLSMFIKNENIYSISSTKLHNKHTVTVMVIFINSFDV